MGFSYIWETPHNNMYLGAFLFKIGYKRKRLSYVINTLVWNGMLGPLFLRAGFDGG